MELAKLLNLLKRFDKLLNLYYNVRIHSEDPKIKEADYGLTHTEDPE